MGQDVDIMSNVFGLDLVSENFPVQLGLHALGIGLLHHVHLPTVGTV